jgi:hypothetical protein
MCLICEPILGHGGLPHTEETCALRQGSYCPTCGLGTHFPRFCPKKARRMRASPQTNQTNQTNQINYIVIANTNEGYLEFLKQNNLPISKKPQENKDTVHDHFASRNITVRNPPVGKITCLPQDTCCKIAHGDNEHCMIRKKVIIRKKTSSPSVEIDEE